MKKKFVIFSILIILAGISAAVFILVIKPANITGSVTARNIINNSGNNVIANKIDNAASGQPSSQNISSTNSSLPSTIPDSILLDVSFLSQAPFGVWDPLHEDACEEASLIMEKHFLDSASLNPTSGDQEIRKMIAYEEKNGYGISITLEQINQIAKDYYSLNTGRVEKNITIDSIKREIAMGRPVIVGAAGKILPNPNFRNGGPNYHMLVIKGYDSQGFITNDPGTRKGEGFHYTYQALFNAVHDWDPGNILNGEKNLLVFY